MQQKTIFFIFTFLLVGTMSFAQPTPPCGSGEGFPPCGGPTAPIDGGLAILLAAGACYGIKKSLKK